MDIGTFAGAFVDRPFLVLVPAVLFGWLYFRRRRWPILAATLAWLAYFPYERSMKTGTLCPGGPRQCNIRIDLLPIYFILALLSLWAIVAYVKAGRAARRT